MRSMEHYRRISKSPTNPRVKERGHGFDVAALYTEPVSISKGHVGIKQSLDEKLRQAYFWITNHAIISPFYDIEYQDGPNQRFVFGDKKVTIELPSGQSYSSYVLLPLLNLAVRRRCLLVGGPGRGKTAVAILMGILAGYGLKDIKRAIQHGQPQMTIADLLGNPLPSTLVNAESMQDISIAWRMWLGMRVKIIDEYNRIPTRTQSALLTIMGDNYAELLDQVYECPESAWYLTANDDGGGGTYQVIEALRDRIDVVVKALHFNTRFLNELVDRIEDKIRPEEIVPVDIVFQEKEIDAMNREIRSISISSELRRRMEFFAAQFEFCESGARQLEYMTKDTVKLAAVDWQAITSDATGKDAIKDFGNQTKNGLSVRAMMTCLVYVKAMAWFRGDTRVSYEDLRQILPFVLHDKLVQNPDSPFFENSEHKAYRSDYISWIRFLFDESCREYERLDLDRDDPVAELATEFEKGLEGVTEQEAVERQVKIERILGEWSKGRKFYSHMYDDILKMKYLHQRYTNYLRWLKWKDA
ncbi:AAA family ATPase [Desulfobacterales bacterium HSG16]|nr:AAA family ATPase [Desulfobacterales bacterium HSG16]